MRKIGGCGVSRDRHRHASAATGCAAAEVPGRWGCRLLGCELAGCELARCELLGLLRRHLLSLCSVRAGDALMGCLRGLMQLIRVWHALRRNLHAIRRLPDRVARRLQQQVTILAIAVRRRTPPCGQSDMMCGASKAVSHPKTQLRQTQQTRHQGTQKYPTLCTLSRRIVRSSWAESRYGGESYQIVHIAAGKSHRKSNQGQQPESL